MCFLKGAERDSNPRTELINYAPAAFDSIAVSMAGKSLCLNVRV